MDIVYNILGVLVGLYGIVKGADFMVDGASSMARRFRIPEVVIGLTVVAFGTSMPEFVVSFFAALKGSGDMSVGNIMGSNIFNSLVILGATAFVATVPVGRRSLYVDIPWSIGAAAVCSVICFENWIFAEPANQLSRIDSLIFLALFVIFMTYNAVLTLKKHHAMEVQQDTERRLWIALKLLGGLTLLIVGGRILVNCASNVALELGVSEAVIALTIVAGGTSAPELVTSIVAARRGSLDMAVGNAIGSNVFNVFFVLGLAGLIHPMDVADITRLDLLMFVGGPLLLWLFALSFRRINRWMGFILVSVYLAYLVLLVRAALGYGLPVIFQS